MILVDMKLSNLMKAITFQFILDCLLEKVRYCLSWILHRTYQGTSGIRSHCSVLIVVSGSKSIPKQQQEKHRHKTIFLYSD